MISSCQRTSVGIRRQVWIARSFTINIHNEPSRNKLSQSFLKMMPNTESVLTWKWVLQVWKELIFIYLRGFNIDCQWQKNSTLEWCRWSLTLDECKTWLRYISAIKHFTGRQTPNTAIKGAAIKDTVTWYCRYIIYLHPTTVNDQTWHQEWSFLTL